MKRLLFFLLMLVSVKTYACSCGFTPFLDLYQRSDFIASAKILKITPDTRNEDYHDVEIQLLDLYKGKPISKLKIYSTLNTSCSFLPSENSTWLLFASNDNNGFLSFGFCSGGMQMDRVFDLNKYPNLDIKYKASIDLKLQALRYLRKKKITDVNKFDLWTNAHRICPDSLKGFKEKNRFAVYTVEVNPDLSITGIKPLKKFSNQELSKQLTYCLQQNLKVLIKREKSIPERTKLLLIYFYYPSEQQQPSFVSVSTL